MSFAAQTRLSGDVQPHATAVRSVLGIEDVAPILDTTLSLARKLKTQAKKGELPKLLDGKTAVLLFEKPSTRTRVSFELGLGRLGMTTTVLNKNDSQMSRGEPLSHTARVLGRFADLIVYRAHRHQDVVDMANWSGVPVINSLTDLEHPCQVLADLLAVEEHFGTLQGKKLAYIGDGNNMCHSYLLAAPLAGMDITVACPRQYAPLPEFVARAKQLARQHGTKVKIVAKPEEAVKGAHVVATDTWVSMGQEGDEEAKLQAFQGYTVDDQLLGQASPDAVFLHCLPAHLGQEVTEDVLEGPRSLVWNEAENRMWVQMALTIMLIGTKPPV